MIKRNFWRRAIAYMIDFFLVTLAVTVITLLLNATLSTNILAPELLKSRACEVRDDLVSKDRMDQLLPLDEGQSHVQVLCWQKNMFATPFYQTTIHKVWGNETSKFRVSVSYYSDKNGNQIAYIPSTPFLYLAAPLLFALFLSYQGQTPGKRLLGLKVTTVTFEHPSLTSALKREYFKAILFIAGGLYGLYTAYTSYNLQLEDSALLAQSMSESINEQNLLVFVAVALVIFVLGMWFLFGSFIRWRGQSYWDRFAKLQTGLIREFDERKGQKNVFE